MNKVALGTGVALAAALLAPAAQAQRAPAASIVVVDVQRVTSECNACRQANTQLNSQLTTLRNRRSQLLTPLQTEAQGIRTAAAALNGRQPDAALQGRITALQQREEAANQELGRGQQNIQSIQANVLQQISRALNPIFTQVMQARGANLIVERGAVLDSVAALDVTNDVLERLNQSLPSVSLTPLQEQPAAQAPARPAQQPNRPRGR